MNIGIYTQSIAGNYGGILQNYALQQVLIQLGHHPITIDHYKPYSRCRWLLGRIRHFGCSANVPFPYYGRIGSKKMLEFAFKNIKRTKSVKDVTPGLIAEYNLDAIIVGSDQVWRKKYNPNVDISFLSFAQEKDIKRLSYAASFGIDEWDYTEIETNKCKKLLAKFDAVSVREESDVTLCNNNLNVKPVHVLDPTLLLDSTHYVKFFVKRYIPNEPYLFAYVLDVDNEKLNFIQQVSKQKQLTPIVMSAENNARNDDCIEKWLTLLAHASFVITDSYHGTLFSIIFKREFIVINNKKRGSSRFQSVLSTFGILERLMDINYIDLEPKHINWEIISSILFAERIKSIDFLKKSLLP